MTVLVLDNVRCQLQGVPVLQGISTQVSPGELVALIGPNGAGKSTLMRAMAGIQEGVSGAVTLDGQAVQALPASELARRRGYLPQAATAAWPVTVRHLVGLGRMPLRAFWQPANRADAVAVQNAMEKTDVVYLADRLVTTLSGGERLRVMLARALAAEPVLMLADEPLAALDPRHQLQTMQLLRAHCDAGGSAVVALHDITLACRFCDRLLLLDCGHAVTDDAPDVVMQSGELERVYRVAFEQVMLDGKVSVLPVAMREC